MIAEVKHYFAQERGEESGDLAAEMVPGFITENLAPGFCNRGVGNADRYTKEATEDMLGVRVG